MRYLLVLLSVVLISASCKQKKTALKDDESVESQEFLEFFEERELPVTIADTVLTRKETDSMTIGYKIFTQFVPDSVLTKDFGKNQPKLYSLGRVVDNEEEHFLMVKAVSGNKRAAYLLAFDKAYQYNNALTLVSTGFHNSTSAYGAVDKKFNITTYRERKQGEKLSFKRNVYIYNQAAKEFTLILTEPNIDMIDTVVNPIDSLPATHALAGDYIKDDKNLITFRDGNSAHELLFFVHFDRDGGECTGELKGTARLTGENTAMYKEVGNPCTLEFTFSKTKVDMREIEGCGSYRDIKCFFEGSFPRKKVEGKK